MNASRTIHIRCKGGPLDGQEFDLDAERYSPFYRVTTEDEHGEHKVLYEESSRVWLGRTERVREFLFVPSGVTYDFRPYFADDGTYRRERIRIDVNDDRAFAPPVEPE